MNGDIVKAGQTVLQQFGQDGSGDLIDLYASIFARMGLRGKELNTAMMVFLAGMSTRIGYPIRLNIVDEEGVFTRLVVPACKTLIPPTDIQTPDDIFAARRKGERPSSSTTLLVTNFAGLCKVKRAQIEGILRETNIGCIVLSRPDETLTVQNECLRIFLGENPNASIVPIEDIATIIGLRHARSIAGIASHFQIDTSSVRPRLSYLDLIVRKNIENVIRALKTMQYITECRVDPGRVIAGGCDLKTYLWETGTGNPTLDVGSSTIDIFCRYADDLFLDGADGVSAEHAETFKIVLKLNMDGLKGNGVFDVDEAEIVRFIRRYPKAWATVDEVTNALNRSQNSPQVMDSVRNSLRYLLNRGYLQNMKDPNDAREDVYAVSSKAPKTTIKLGPQDAELIG